MFEHADEEEEIDEASHEKDDHSDERLSSEVLFHLDETSISGWAIIYTSEQVEITSWADTLALEIFFKNGKDSIELLLQSGWPGIRLLTWILSTDSGVALFPVGGSSNAPIIVFGCPCSKFVINFTAARFWAHKFASNIDWIISLDNKAFAFNDQLFNVWRFGSILRPFSSHSFSRGVAEPLKFILTQEVHAGGNEGHDESKSEENDLEDLEKCNAHAVSLAFLSTTLHGKGTLDEHVHSENVNEHF